jgi:hypothetical protein
LWHATEGTGPTVQYLVKGDCPTLSVANSPEKSPIISISVLRWVASVIVVLLLALAVRWGILGRWMDAAPRGLTAVVGLIWWCWLWPGWLGAFLLAAAFASWWAERWGRKRQSAATATISLRHAPR